MPRQTMCSNPDALRRSHQNLVHIAIGDVLLPRQHLIIRNGMPYRPSRYGDCTSTPCPFVSPSGGCYNTQLCFVYSYARLTGAPVFVGDINPMASPKKMSWFFNVAKRISAFHFASLKRAVKRSKDPLAWLTRPPVPPVPAST